VESGQHFPCGPRRATMPGRGNVGKPWHGPGEGSMDGHRFDEWARTIAASGSRRRLLAGFAAAALGLAGVRPGQAACRAPGTTCRENANCCSGLCGPKDATRRRRCRCQFDADCPAADCRVRTCDPTTGLCSNPTVAPDGTPCTSVSGGSCCSGVCGIDACTAPTCASGPCACGLCFTDVNNVSRCGGNFQCSSTPFCTTNAECVLALGAGSYCQGGSNPGGCGEGVCVPPCPLATATSFEDGPTNNE
jgi:hypothetical protein